MKDSRPIPLAVPDLRGRELEYLQRCVHDNWVSSAGPFVTELEEAVARNAGRCHGVAVVNGTAALHLALLAAGVRPGDFVIVPDWTFAASANAVYHCGAIPYFVDIATDSWTLDPGMLADVLKRSKEPIAAVLAVDTLGHPADYDALAQAAGTVPIVSDAAGSIGAFYKGQPTGAFGACATLSFNGNKTVTAGGGGMVLIDDDEVAQRIRHLSTQARVGADYLHDERGFNYRMTNVNAAIGLAQLERLSELVEAKQTIARRYDDFVATCPHMEAMPRLPWAESSCWLYSVAVTNAETAAGLLRYLNDRGVGARSFWRSLSAQGPYSDSPAALTGVSRQLSGRVVSLPCSTDLAVSDQYRIIDLLSAWYPDAVSASSP
ncbi:MAG: pyridoxal-5'-phosphate-dependent protein [Alphaproteobacteria bacterium]|nr:pyridoxal-5'-phosphate-dependent protein [Alphaproteobacteria bacterium]